MREGVRLASRADAWMPAGLLRRADRLPDLVDQITVRRKPATVWLANCVVGHSLLDLARSTVPHQRTRQTSPSSSMRPTSSQTARPTVLRPSSASDDQRSLRRRPAACVARNGACVATSPHHPGSLRPATTKESAIELRRRLPGTGVLILPQCCEASCALDLVGANHQTVPSAQLRC